MKPQSPFRKTSWSPGIVGFFIGILTIITFVFMLEAPGASTFFVRIVGFIISLFSTKHIAATPYLANYVEFKPIFEWQSALMVGIFFGAWVSAKLSKTTFSSIPYMWGEHFGFNNKRRIVSAITGGIMILFGARLAGGCTLGHGISGALQLATASWLFLVCLMVSGVISAKLLYHKRK